MLSEPVYQEGCWRLNIFLDKDQDIQFKMRPYEKSSYSPYTLKCYPEVFYEKSPHFKKMDFAKRLRLLKLAHLKKVSDWIFFNKEGFLLETSISNLFWIKKDSLYTPDPSLPYYFGVTLQVVIEAAKNLGYRTYFVKKKEDDLKEADQVFICNSMKEIVDVYELDGEKLNRDAAACQKLRSEYKRLVSREDAFLPNH